MLPVLAVHVASLSLEMFWHLFLTKRSNRRWKNNMFEVKKIFCFRANAPSKHVNFAFLEMKRVGKITTKEMKRKQRGEEKEGENKNRSKKEKERKEEEERRREK